MHVTTCSRRPVLVPSDLPEIDCQIDPYIGCEHQCHYCYVLGQAETNWAEEVQIHEDVVEQLRSELDEKNPKSIHLGYLSDPYQPCEAESLQTRKILETLVDRDIGLSILTKSDLVLRDIDLLQKMRNVHVNVSVAFNDDQTRQHFEAGTMETEKRIDALHQLKDAGVGTGALICPIIPFITDTTALLDKLLPHSVAVWIYGLSVQDHTDPGWQNVLGILNKHFPDMKERIESVVLSKDHVYWSELRQELMDIQNETDVELIIRV